MSGLDRQLSAEEVGAALLRALMVGPVRALDLIKRMPEEFRRRGWPLDEDSIAVVACAVGAVKIHAGAQVFRLPLALLQHEHWRLLAEDMGEGARVTALQIVERMELQRLLEPK